MWTYRTTLLKWVDADTADFRIDLGFRVFSDQRVRLAGINAPELHTRDAGERARAVAAHVRVREMLPEGAPCTVATEKTEKFGRWLGTVVTASGVDVNAVLLAEGLARPYDGGSRG